MSTKSVLLLISCSLMGCASTPVSDDYQLQNLDLAVSLTVAEGLPPFPANGAYFAVPGYIFVAGQMVTHPGVRRISYSCPGDWEWQQVTHFVPSIEYNFEAGRRYELYCDAGYPKVRPRK